MATNCNFTSVDDEVKSTIIQNCQSKRLRRYALIEPEITLAKLIAKGRAYELSEIQAKGIEQSLAPLTIGDDEPQSALTLTSSRKQHYSRSAKLNDIQEKTQQCRNCGGLWPHTTTPCPAKNKTCLNCGKANHFAKVCRSAAKKPETKPKKMLRSRRKQDAERRRVRRIASRSQEETSSSSSSSCDSTDSDFAYTLNPNLQQRIPYAQIKINDAPVNMVIDTGASVDIIDEHTLKTLSPVCLQRSTARIFAYGAKRTLPILGQFKARLKSSTCTATAQLQVIKGKHGCLLSHQTATALNLITLHVQALRQSVPQVPSHELLIKKYPQLFEGVGTLKNFEVKLHIDQTVTPVAQPARRIPFHLRQKVTKALNDLEEQGIIEKAEGPTPWISPLVLTPKKDGDTRLCVDMRMPNRAIQRERHPSPTADDLTHALNGAIVFSKLDLRSGYHQLCLSKESRYITTFATHQGLFRYKKLNFGTSSASEIFQLAINEQIHDIPNAINISDDVIIYGKTQAEHDQALEAVFHRFSSNGLTLNRKKCVFNQSELTFFGLVFSSQGVSPDPQKVDAIHNAPPPSSAKGVRSFLGMATYCAKFIPNFSDLTEPLRDLTKKNTPFCWTSRHDKAFQDVKTALTSQTVMAYFDETKETELVTDASPTGLSAILSQKTPGTGERKIVAYVSRSLSDVERRYSQTEREALAIVWAIERLHLYLYGGHFTLITDCKPVELILNNPQSKPPARIERWNLRLQDYDFAVQYVKGPENPSDYLSRHPNTSPQPTMNTPCLQAAADHYISFLAQHAVPRAMTLLEIQEATKADPTLQAVVVAIHSNQWPSITSPQKIDPAVSLSEMQTFSKIKAELTVNEQDNIILRGSRIVLPVSLRHRAIQIAHEGHQGLVKTKKLLREKVWFPGIDALAKQILDNCNSCQANGPSNPPEPLRMTNLPPQPWHTVNIDFCGPFPSGEYLLVVIDAYSRFPEVEVVHSTLAKSTISQLEKIFARHGIPQIIKTDNGPPFSGHEYRLFMKEIGGEHRPSTPLWPQGNAEAENFMKPLVKAIKSAHNEKRNWKRELSKFLLNYRATPHTTTNVAPAELLYNRKIRTKLPNVTTESKKHGEVKERDATAKKKMKNYADARSRAKLSEIKEGDTVLVRQKKKNKLSTRFDPCPYRVTKRKGNRITAVRNKKFISRNVSLFKKVPSSMTNQSNDIYDNDDYFSDSNEHEQQEPQDVPEAAEPPPAHRYPVREHRPVHRYGQNIYEN